MGRSIRHRKNFNPPLPAKSSGLVENWRVWHDTEFDGFRAGRFSGWVYFLKLLGKAFKSETVGNRLRSKSYKMSIFHKSLELLFQLCHWSHNAVFNFVDFKQDPLKLWVKIQLLACPLRQKSSFINNCPNWPRNKVVPNVSLSLLDFLRLMVNSVSWEKALKSQWPTKTHETYNHFQILSH